MREIQIDEVFIVSEYIEILRFIVTTDSLLFDTAVAYYQQTTNVGLYDITKIIDTTGNKILVLLFKNAPLQKRG